jgi:hypothetical protein
MQRSFSGKPGQLYSESDYFDLTAKDADGVVWTTERAMPPRCNWRSEEDNPIISGNLATLTTERAISGQAHSTNLHFFGDVELPLIIDAFEFSDGDYKFAVRKLEGAFSIEVTSSSALPKDFPGRVQEALRFMLAQPVSWRGLTVSEGIRQTFRIASAVPQSRNTRLYPPIGRGKSHAYIDDCWCMFRLYLQYVLRSSRPSYWNYCSYHLHNACESSANSLDAWSYGLSIAVEGLTALLPPKKKDETNTLLQTMHKDILTFVRKMECYESLLRRLDGLLGSMGNEPPPNRMHLLIPSGHLDEDHVAAWKTLRNKFVHPKGVDLQTLNEQKLQELIFLIHKVTVLMYHIVFYIIGYSGHYTDYATLNFPDKAYPLITPKAADQTT